MLGKPFPLTENIKKPKEWGKDFFENTFFLKKVKVVNDTTGRDLLDSKNVFVNDNRKPDLNDMKIFKKKLHNVQKRHPLTPPMYGNIKNVSPERGLNPPRRSLKQAS